MVFYVDRLTVCLRCVRVFVCVACCCVCVLSLCGSVLLLFLLFLCAVHCELFVVLCLLCHVFVYSLMLCVVVLVFVCNSFVTPLCWVFV